MFRGTVLVKEGKAFPCICAFSYDTDGFQVVFYRSSKENRTHNFRVVLSGVSTWLERMSIHQHPKFMLRDVKRLDLSNPQMVFVLSES